MNLKYVWVALISAPLFLAACSKPEKATTTEQGATSEVAVETSNTVTPEQQAAIDAIDKPIQDEHNTDVPTEISNAPADEATADTTK